MKRVRIGQESAEHKELKQSAKLWLLKLGATDIQEEARVRYTASTSKYGAGKLKVDVMGYSGDVSIAIECGGSTATKLRRLASCVTEIYILPYGQLIPFRWSALDNICRHCGNKV